MELSNYVRDLLERFVRSQEQITELFEARGKIDEALVAKWQRDNELRAAELELREREFERFNRWRAEDLEKHEQNRRDAREAEERSLDRLWGRKPSGDAGEAK